MIGGGTEYTFNFAWIASGLVPWDASMARFDENIFSLLIEHDEGQIPTALVEVINPEVGLISPARMVWCWISFSYDGCGPMPLFRGRLLGVPEDITGTTISMKFIARPPDYMYQKQQMARLLKVLPNYDLLFTEASKRDDPDAILEGWSALYHVDRVDNRVSASDIVLGEDGTITFAPRDIFYDNFTYRTLQSPLAAVNVKMDVQWEQQYRGAFHIGQWAYPTLGSDAFVGDWPKSGAALGSGWFAGISWAGERDPSIEAAMLLTQKPQVTSISYQWVNTEDEHETGDTMSVSLNYTPPWGQQIVLRTVNIMGLIDPNATDGRGNPKPVNRPAHQEVDWFCYQTFALDFLGKQSLATIGLTYEADRKRSEKLEMTISADVQPVLVDPTVAEDTEQITLKSGDLSLPVIELLNWSTVGMGGAVTTGQIVFPDNPLVPGQTSSQIALNNGNTGMVVPTFSNIAGVTTLDGTVTWVSLGSTPPTDGSQDWVRLGRVPLGALLLPKPVSGVPDIHSVRIPGELNYPPTGTAVAVYSIYSVGLNGPGAAMMECTTSGLVGGLGGAQAVFRTFFNPSGAFMYIAVQAGITGEFHTTFSEPFGTQTHDGSVIWQSLGRVELPIGGTPGMTPAHSFFPTDRGQLAVQHGACRALAKLRKRARAVQLGYDTRFEVAAQLSCRMNGKVTDIRLPGGGASGKVIGYKLEVNGDTRIVKGSFLLGCSIGKHAVDAPATRALPVPDPGVPSYVGVTGPPNGYVKRGYQKYYSSGTLLTPGDPDWRPPGTPPDQTPPLPPPPTPVDWPHTPPTLPPASCPPLNSLWSPGPVDLTTNAFTYTPPVSSPNDDGITFPISLGSGVVLRNQWHGLASTINPLNLQIYRIQLDQIIHNAVAQANQTKQVNFPAVGGVASGSITVPISPYYDIQVAVQIAVLKSMLQGSQLWYELVMKPLNTGPYTNYYVVQSPTVPMLQTIDLSAPAP